MTDTNITIVGIIVGMLLVFFFIGIGVILSDVRHYFATKGTTERGCVCDNGTDTVLCRRHCDRGGNNGCAEEMESEEVICGLENINLSLSGKEKEFLGYAIEAVRMRRRLENYIKENEA